jgi:hypothetical protein
MKVRLDNEKVSVQKIVFTANLFFDYHFINDEMFQNHLYLCKMHTHKYEANPSFISCANDILTFFPQFLSLPTKNSSTFKYVLSVLLVDQTFILKLTYYSLTNKIRFTILSNDINNTLQLDILNAFVFLLSHHSSYKS